MRAEVHLSRVIAVAIGFIVGLYVASRLAASFTWWATGFDAEREVGDPDCDQCALTAVLDGIGYYLAAMTAYLVIAVLAIIWLRRRGWFRCRS